MDYIILDIEFNGRKFASDKPMEVIEIGAVRLNEELRPIDHFESLIKPVYFSKLNSFIRQKTGIAQAEIDAARGFKAVYADFIRWLTKSEPYLLVTWGGEDVKRIVLDVRMHELDDSRWLTTPYYDLLKGYIRSRKLTNDVSVEAAVTELGIPVSEAAHRALEDAKMTARLFAAVFDQLDTGEAQLYKDMFTNAKERRAVKNIIRTMIAKKEPMHWEKALEAIVAKKIAVDEPKKLEELRQYFESEKEKRPTALKS